MTYVRQMAIAQFNFAILLRVAEMLREIENKINGPSGPRNDPNPKAWVDKPDAAGRAQMTAKIRSV